jgi:hypothetical protein
MLIGSAAMTNVRRIQRYLAVKQEQENECKETKRREDRKKDQKSGQKCAPKLQGDIFFAIFVGRLNDYLQLFSLRGLCFGC